MTETLENYAKRISSHLHSFNVEKKRDIFAKVAKLLITEVENPYPQDQKFPLLSNIEYNTNLDFIEVKANSNNSPDILGLSKKVNIRMSDTSLSLLEFIGMTLLRFAFVAKYFNQNTCNFADKWQVNRLLCSKSDYFIRSFLECCLVVKENALPHKKCIKLMCLKNHVLLVNKEFMRRIDLLKIIPLENAIYNGMSYIVSSIKLNIIDNFGEVFLCIKPKLFQEMISSVMVTGTTGNVQPFYIKKIRRRCNNHSVFDEECDDCRKFNYILKECVISKQVTEKSINNISNYLGHKEYRNYKNEIDKHTLYMQYIQSYNMKLSMETLYCLTESEARQILFPLKNAIENCIQVDVIHRDINPYNIMINAKKNNQNEFIFVPYLIDFGIACINAGRTTFNTTFYMAPEMVVANGVQQNYNYLVDIFSFGAIAASLLQHTHVNDTRLVAISCHAKISVAAAKLIISCTNENPFLRPDKITFELLEFFNPNHYLNYIYFKKTIDLFNNKKTIDLFNNNINQEIQAINGSKSVKEAVEVNNLFNSLCD